MLNKIRVAPLMLAIGLTACQQAGPGAAGESVEPAAEVVERPEPVTAPVELSDAQLCQQLTAEEVTTVFGSQRTAGAYALGGCRYESPHAPALRLFNSSHASREEHLDLIKGLKGSCKDGPDGAILCSVGFDSQNAEISGIWFRQDQAALELESDGGMAESEALALLAAARG